MTTPLLHLVIGSTGAGKTTYARRLADEIGGVRFSIDEWMSALFWPDAPQPPDAAWAITRVERCADRIWRTAIEIVTRDCPVVLEIGLTTRVRRRHFARLAAEAGSPARFHLLDLPAEERWARVEARNRARKDAAAQLDFAITRAMFDDVEATWEAPDAAERAAYDMVDARA